MPDTLDVIAFIGFGLSCGLIGWTLRAALLAHIDALTAAVEALPDFAFAEEMPDAPRYIDRAAVLAILRGEQ